MIHIDRLCFHLPSVWQPHARDFANHFARELANVHFSQEVNIESLKLGPIIVDPQFGVSAAVSAAVSQFRQEIDRGNHAESR